MDYFFAGAFLCAGEDGAEHDGVGTGYDGFGNVAGVADAAIGDDGDGTLEGLGDDVDSSDLGYTDAADDTGGADGAGADADFDGFGAFIAEGDGGFGGGDVASDNVDFGVVFGNPFGHVHDAFGVAVGAIDNDDIDVFRGEGFDALFVAGADGGADTQAVAGIAVVEGFDVADEGADVGEAVESDEFVVVDEG